jgi:hypothetical protein
MAENQLCKGPFPRTYKSVVQPAVQGSVQPVTYTFEVNLSCTASRAKIMAGKFKLVWAVYVCMMVTLVSRTSRRGNGICHVHGGCCTKMQCGRQAVRSKCTFMEMDLKKTTVLFLNVSSSLSCRNLGVCVCVNVYSLEKMLAIQKFLSGLLSHFRILVD